jgi:hypothetical protein
MAITSPNAVYVGQAGVPAYSGQIIASGGSDQVELAYKATATFTLDGSTTSVAVNLIDGVNTLPFTPSGVLCNVSGGTQQSAAPVSVTVKNITNTVLNLVLSAAGTASNTVTVTFIVLK